MAEIKSTIELMMERTKNLTMTEEEKTELHRQELLGKVRGWIIRYLQSGLDMESLKSEIKQESVGRTELETAFKKLLPDYLEPGKDNTRMLQLLSEFTNVGEVKLKVLLESFLAEREELIKERLPEAKTGLEQQGIRGAAVVPNIDSYETWQADLRKLEQSFKLKVAAVMACE